MSEDLNEAISLYMLHSHITQMEDFIDNHNISISARDVRPHSLPIIFILPEVTASKWLASHSRTTQATKRRRLTLKGPSGPRMAGSRPVTPASPRLLRIKTREAGVPLHGCEHLRRLMTQGQETASSTIQHYRYVLRVVLDKARIISQTSISPSQPPVTSLTPNYLCLQCPVTLTAADRPGHAGANGHQFYVDSRSGSLFCEVCNDFIWDPTLEDLRLRKIGTGFSAGRKRKHNELFADTAKEDSRYYASNTTPQCRSMGLRGIYNMGSTCFMSVVLQSFVHNPLLRNFYLGDGHKTGRCNQEECLSCGITELFQDFYGQNTTAGYIAADLLATSWSSQQSKFKSLSGDDEQDAHEFFQFLAEVLHETTQNSRQTIVEPAIDREPEKKDDCKCIVHQTFYGQIQQSMTCHYCKHVLHTYQPFLDLNLGIEDPACRKHGQDGTGSRPLTLQGCLSEEFTDAEKIEQYQCNTCGDDPGEALVERSIRRLPNVLSIQFKRFVHHKVAKTSSKIDRKVQFPLSLNMLPYTSRAGSQTTNENFELARNCTYDLLSVVVHQGDLTSGHYTSYSKVDDQWFLFDDHKVTMASESQVLGAEAFILFYIVRSLA